MEFYSYIRIQYKHIICEIEIIYTCDYIIKIKNSKYVMIKMSYDDNMQDFVILWGWAKKSLIRNSKIP